MENSFFVQISVENKSTNHMFIDTVNFKANEALLQVNDLNFIDEDTIFDETAVFLPTDVRNYVF